MDEEEYPDDGVWPFCAIVVSVVNAICWAFMASPFVTAGPQAWMEWLKAGASFGLIWTGFLVIGLAVSIVGPVRLMRRRKPRATLACAGGLLALLLAGIWLSVRLNGT